MSHVTIPEWRFLFGLISLSTFLRNLTFSLGASRLSTFSYPHLYGHSNSGSGVRFVLDDPFCGLPAASYLNCVDQHSRQRLVKQQVICTGSRFVRLYGRRHFPQSYSLFGASGGLRLSGLSFLRMR